MPQTLFMLFCFLLSVEAFVICIGNAFAIFVFWQKRLTLRQTSYLLINLAVSDLLVGVWELISLASGQVPNLFSVSFHKDTLIPLVNFITTSLTIFFSSSSSCCLALISIERAFSVLRLNSPPNSEPKSLFWRHYLRLDRWDGHIIDLFDTSFLCVR